MRCTFSAHTYACLIGSLCTVFFYYLCFRRYILCTYAVHFVFTTSISRRANMGKQSKKFGDGTLLPLDHSFPMTSLTHTETVLGKRKAYVLHLASSPELSTAQSDSEYEPPEEPIASGTRTPARSRTPAGAKTPTRSRAPSRPRTPKAATGAPIIVNGQLVNDTKKRYACTYEGCDKAYSKPSRLEEHVRSHTGQVRTSDRPVDQRL